MPEDPFSNIPPEHLDELKRMAEASEIPKRKLAGTGGECDNSRPHEYCTVHDQPLDWCKTHDQPLAQEQETATQKLADLTQELGLYDDSFEPDFGQDALVDPVCPFCGAAEPCPSHRAGG